MGKRAGRATVVHDGRSFAVDRPHVVPMADAVDDFGPRERRVLGLLDVQECLRLHTAAAPGTT